MRVFNAPYEPRCRIGSCGRYISAHLGQIDGALERCVNEVPPILGHASFRADRNDFGPNTLFYGRMLAP